MTGLDLLGVDPHEALVAIQRDLADAAAKLRALEPVDATGPLAATADRRERNWLLAFGALGLVMLGSGLTWMWYQEA